MGKKIKNRDILEIQKILTQYANTTDPWFTFGAYQNLDAIEGTVKSLEAARKPASEFMRYEEKRMELVKKFCRKDENGKPITRQVPFGQGMFQTIFDVEDEAALEDAVKELRAQDDNEAILESEEKRKARYEELLDEETEVNVFTMKQSDAPENIVKGIHMKYLIPAGMLDFDLKRE